MIFKIFKKTGELRDRQGDWDGDQGYYEDIEIGEPCPRCHNGKGVQVYPVPREAIQGHTSMNLCSGVSRLRKHSPTKN